MANIPGNEEGIDRDVLEKMREKQPNLEERELNQENTPGQSEESGLGENQRLVEVAGQKVVVETDEEGNNRVGNPEGLEGEALKNWQEKAENEVKAMSIATQKYQQTSEAKKQLDEEYAKRQREIEEREQRLRAEQEKFNKQRTEAETQQRIARSSAERSEQYAERVMKELGIKTSEEYQDKLDEDRLAVLKAERKVANEMALEEQEQQRKQIEESLLQKSAYNDLANRVANDGYKMEDFERWARNGQLPVNQRTFGFFKQEAQQNKLGFEINNIQRVKQQTVSFLPLGDIAPSLSKKPKTWQQHQKDAIRDISNRKGFV